SPCERTEEEAVTSACSSHARFVTNGGASRSGRLHGKCAVTDRDVTIASRSSCSQERLVANADVVTGASRLIFQSVVADRDVAGTGRQIIPGVGANPYITT